MKRDVKYCNMLIHSVYLCVHESRYLCVDFFSAAKIRCANFRQFLWWTVTRCVWGCLGRVFLIIRLLGAKPTGKSTDKSTKKLRLGRWTKTGCQRGRAGVRHKVTAEWRLPISGQAAESSKRRLDAKACVATCAEIADQRETEAAIVACFKWTCHVCVCVTSVWM